jgi:TolB-like protein
MKLHLSIILCAALLSWGCAASRSTRFVHPEYDFTQIERVAVIPFENLSSEQGTGSYVSRVFVTELLATGAFDVVEQGEVTRVLEVLGQARAAELDLDKLKKVGEQLAVQCVIFGSVGESAPLRSGTITAHMVSLDVRMADCATGSTVWSATTGSSGPGFIARLLGLGESTRGKAIRQAVKRSVKSLLD